MDEEIQQLMEELILKRTQQKDYQSLENQVRCLRQRFENLGDQQKNEVKKQNNQLDNHAQEIDDLSGTVDNMHQQQLADQAEYGSLRQDYIALNEGLGQKEQELAGLRQECTQQLSFNKEMERQSDQLEHENARLNMHKRECAAEVKRTNETTVKLEREVKDQSSQIQQLDQSMLAVEQEIAIEERRLAELEQNIADRKSALNRARQTSGDLVGIINDLQSHTNRLRDENQELTRQMEQLNQELQQLAEKRNQVNNENGILKNHSAQFESEKQQLQNENYRLQNEKDKIENQQDELNRRLQELQVTQTSLSIKQKDIESQLEDFVHENERIRMQILERDRIAQDLRSRGRQEIEESAYQVAAASPVRGSRRDPTPKSYNVSQRVPGDNGSRGGTFQSGRDNEPQMRRHVANTSPLRDSPPHPKRSRSRGNYN